MKIAVIGRTNILFQSTLKLVEMGHKITTIITAKEAPEYSKKTKDFENLASNLNASFSTGVPIKKHYNLLKESNSDIAISVNYPGIISKEIIDLFPLGILNAHGGDLPRYRGNACQAWAILNGEEKIGLCIHKMIGGEIDAGDIIERDYYRLDNETNITQVLNWILERTPNMFSNSIKKLEENENFILKSQSKNNNDILRCYPLIPSDGEIKWNIECIKILRLINAFNKPFGGAFSYINNEKIIIWDAKIVKYKTSFCAMPGQILQLNENFVDVATKEDILRIFSIEVNSIIQKPSRFITSIRTRFSNMNQN